MRLLFFLLIISGFFGQYLYLFNDKVHLIRVFPLCLVLLYAGSGVKLNRDAFVLLSYFSAYYIYTLIVSLFNLSHLNPNDLVNLTVFYFFIIALIVSANAAPEPYFSVFKKAIYVFIISSLVVWVYELVTYKHLAYSLAADFPSDYYYQPTTTFFTNPNDFAAIFTLCVMFLLSFLSGKSFRNKVAIIFLIVAEIAICYTTKARVNLVCFCFFALFYFNLWKVKTFVTIGLTLIVIILVTKRTELNWEGLLSFWDTSQGGSMSIRMDLYYHGLLSILYDYGLGFGVVGHHYYYDKIVGLEIIDPHNFLLELWIGSGIIITSLYLLLLLYVLNVLICRRNKLMVIQFVLYNFILLSSSSSLFLWPHYLFFIAYIFYRDSNQTRVQKTLR